MILAALGFVFGAWLLQQQPDLNTFLPSIFIGLQAVWILVPSLAVFIYLYQSKFSRLLKSICGLLIAALLGFMWAANFAAVRLSDALPADWQQKSINIIGVVASLPEVTERGERFKFDVEKILTPQAKLPQHISLNFYRNEASPRPEDAPTANNHFHAGERWQFTVRLKRPHTTYNPHGFDFEAWALAENIRATGSIHSKSGYKKLANFVWRPSYMVETIREKIGNRISQTLENKPYAGVIRALVVGDDSQISQTQWNIFLHTGVNHLISISGLHITMLAGLMYAIVAFAWRRIPSFVMYMPAHKAATIAGLIVALVYALLAGMSVPTQRTLLMLTTFALALIARRNIAISRALAIALLVVVIVDPWAVIAPGFWLSFGAVALIACITVARLKPMSAFNTAVHTQWAITLGLLPLLIVMFGQASIISPVANAFAIPVISLLVVPLSILGGFIPVDFILHAAYFVLEICMEGLMFLSNLPTWQQAAPPIWALLLAMFGVVWILLPRGFPQRWLGAILLLPLFYTSQAKLAEGEMRATVLDVGQGLAMVVQTRNHTFLYDAGPRYSAQSDAGSRIVVPFLRGAGIKKLDGFIISHDDLDHSGGATSVLAQLTIGWFASSFTQTDSMIFPPKAIKCFAGQKWHWDKVEFEVLAPTLASYEDASIKDNNRSCVVKISSQFGSLLLPGDIEKEAENALLDDVIESNGLQDTAFGDAVYPRLASRLKSDVVIAPHHGSKTSSTSEFVQAVGAQHTIFTVGYLNRFKHPKEFIENRFAENGALTYRSDYHGALTLDFTQTNGISVNAWRQSQPRYWHDKY